MHFLLRYVMHYDTLQSPFFIDNVTVILFCFCTIRYAIFVYEVSVYYFCTLPFCMIWYTFFTIRNSIFVYKVTVHFFSFLARYGMQFSSMKYSYIIFARYHWLMWWRQPFNVKTTCLHDNEICLILYWQLVNVITITC